MRAPPLLLACVALACGLMPPQESHAPQTQPPPPPPPPPPPSEIPALPPPGFTLLWQDEFGGTALDASKWTAMTGARRDAENTADALSVKDGVLAITTYTDAGVHKTGFLTTTGKFETTYGYFEARIRFADAGGEWCAFWLQASTNGQPKGDPAHAGVEIDVVEHRVTDQSGFPFENYVALNLNWDGYGPDRQNRQRVLQVPGGAQLQGEWHTYGVLWNATGYTFYVDAIPLWTTSDAVSQRSETLQLTCEVADGEWAGYVPKGGYGPLGASTTGMQVDYVRVWQAPP